MTDYISPVPVPQDADALTQAVYDYLAANIPGWTPADGSLVAWLTDALSLMVASFIDITQQQTTAIFRYFGASLLARHLPFLAPIGAAAATVSTLWTAVDSQGYTIPAGTLVGFQVAGDTLIGFTVDIDAVIPAGSTTVDNVSLTAEIAGAAANGLTAPVVMVDDLVWVSSITAHGTPAGGVDAETDDAYLSRLSDQLSLLAPRPILPLDFAKFALNVVGVGRSMAIDGYNPADSTTGNERMVTVAVTDAAGANCTSGEKTAVQTLLESAREVNFVANVIDPTRTTVDVTFTGEALDGYDAASVQAAAVSAVTMYLDPANWGPQYGPWPGTVRLLAVASVIAATPGFTFTAGGSVLINGTAADLTLTGVAPLPTVGTITGTVT